MNKASGICWGYNKISNISVTGVLEEKEKKERAKKKHLSNG